MRHVSVFKRVDSSYSVYTVKQWLRVVLLNVSLWMTVPAQFRSELLY
jgi:hypothetical protein